MDYRKMLENLKKYELQTLAGKLQLDNFSGKKRNESVALILDKKTGEEIEAALLVQAIQPAKPNKKWLKMISILIGMKKEIPAILFLLLFFIPISLLPAKKQVTFTWYGQSCFLMVTTGNTRIITDPVMFKGYKLPENTRADIVTVSHEHVDHNKVSAVSGNPEVLRGWDANGKKIKEIDKKIKDVRIYTVPSYHSKARIGLNAIFVFEFDGLRIAHLGDLGLTLSDSQVKAIGAIDILMLPVGGQFTISGAEADTVVKQLNVKRIVFPMHYKTAAADFFPYSADDYTNRKQNVKRITGNTFVLDLDNLRHRLEYIALDY